MSEAESRVFVAGATDPASLDGLLDGVEVVVSSLGITRQKDGVTYEEVDYQANVNLLPAAEAAGMVAPAYGSHRLADHYAQLAADSS